MIIEEEIKKLLDKNLIERTTSQYISPIVLIKKKDGGIRFCIDYRKLNSFTIKKPYPLPRIDDAVEGLEGSRFYSTLDLESGYHQIRLKSRDQNKTAFISKNGVFKWKCMPFGLVNAPYTFQRIMNHIFQDVLWHFVIIYLDDIIIYSKTEKEHLEHIKFVFERLEEYKFKAKISKCKILKSKIAFLGYEIENNRISIPMKQKNKVFEYKEPKNISDLKKFLGFTSFFRRFIPKFTEIVSPLLERTKKNNFKFEEKERAAFVKIQSAISESVDLFLPDFTKKFIIHCDASNLIIGGVLLQENKNEEYPIFYVSRKLSQSELNYTTTEKECLSIVWCIKQFRVYLANEFTLKTDHLGLKWLMSQKDVRGRLARWVIFLQQYKFNIEYIKGKENVIADALTRELLNKEAVVNYVEELTEQEKKEILGNLHEEAGHPGIEVTYILVAQKQQWKGMYTDVKNYVVSCTVCKLYNNKNLNLQKFRINLKEPFSRIGIDCIGPLPKSESGKKFIVIATDYTTRYAESKALKSKSTNEIAKFIIHDIFLRHGVPDEILSDQGKEFSSKLVKKICELVNCKKSFTSAYNPKCNGLAERVNRTIISKLAKYANGKWEQWDEYLPYATFAYLITPMKFNRKSPFEMIYGRASQFLSDVTDITKDNNKLNKVKMEENESILFERLAEIRKDLVKQAILAREEEISKVNKGKNVEDLEVGNVVMRRRLGIDVGNKFEEKWVGPFTIIKKLRNGGYVIEDWNKKKSLYNRKDLQIMEGAETEGWLLSEKGCVLDSKGLLMLEDNDSKNGY